MYKLLSIALLAFAAVSQAAPAAEPMEKGIANIEARKVKLTTVGYKTKTYTTVITTTKPIVKTICHTKTTKKGGKKTTITVTDTTTSTETVTSTVVSTTTSPIVSTVTTTTTAQPVPTTTVAPTTTTDSSTTTETSPTPTASSQSRPCSQLPASFTDSNGKSYTNSCNTDAYGGDLSLVYTDSFEDCYAACDSTDGCVGFVYHGGDSRGPCYLKSTINPTEAATGDDLAVLN